jgi:cobalt transporter subunit CbtB
MFVFWEGGQPVTIRKPGNLPSVNIANLQTRSIWWGGHTVCGEYEKVKLLTEIENMKNNEFKTIEVPQTNAAAETASVVMSAVLAFSIGIFLVFGAALANSSTLHNAAHDGRHAFTVPCH